MIELMVAGSFVVAVVLAGTLDGGRTSARATALIDLTRPENPYNVAELRDVPDLPCPWCEAPTREEDFACPSCGQRFG